MSGTAPDFGATWIGGVPEWDGSGGNFDFTQGAVDGIIHHHTATTLAGAISWFQRRRSPSGTSAHFIVGRDGSKNQMLPLNAAAYGAGDLGANRTKIQIENEQNCDAQGNPLEDFTEIQYQSSLELSQAIAAYFQFPLDADHVKPHNFYTSTSCPGNFKLWRITGGPVPTEIKPYRRLTGVVFDTPTNDRGFYDYATLPNSYTQQDAVAGEPVIVDRARLASDGNWYWGIVGSQWAINDNAVDLTAEGTVDGHPTQLGPQDFVTDPHPPAPPPPTPPPTAHGTPIMGAAVATAGQMQAYLEFNAVDKGLAGEMIGNYLTIGASEGVRGDGALMQACKETAFFRFGGDVKPEQNNYAGIGATGNGEPGLSFPTIQDGIRAHLRHLRAYATIDPLPADTDTVDSRARFVLRGTAPTFQALGAHWAPAADYGTDIETRLTVLLALPEPTPPPPLPLPPADDFSARADDGTLVPGGPTIALALAAARDWAQAHRGHSLDIFQNGKPIFPSMTVDAVPSEPPPPPSPPPTSTLETRVAALEAWSKSIGFKA